MKGLFSQYDYARDIDYAEVWKSALFVFDTNVLLNLYRYQKRTREELLETLDKLANRVWIPYHVALEFQRNRLYVIAEQGGRFSDISKVIESARNELNNGINKLQLTKRHSLIDPEPLISGFQELADNFLNQLDVLRKDQQFLTNADPIKNKLDELFDNKVGAPSESQGDVDALSKEAESRFKYKIPPGYKDDIKDKDRPDEYAHNGLVYKRKYGDYFVWTQILTHAKINDVKSLVFVTDDSKEDWWCQIDFEGPKTVGPRSELIEEALRVGHIESFLMYKPESFLKFAGEYLAAKVSEETLSEVHDVSLENRLKNARRQEIQQEYVEMVSHVVSWIKSRHSAVVENPVGFPDILCMDAGNVHGYEIKKFKKVDLGVLKSTLFHAVNSMFRHTFSTLTIVFVVDSVESASRFQIALGKISTSSAPDNLKICIGQISGDEGSARFQPLQEVRFIDFRVESLED